MTIISHLSLFTAALGVLIIIIILWRIHLEEAVLKSTYPDYASYASKTKRLIPYIY